MLLSVEISSYNRSHILLQTLAHLAAQTYPKDRFEVIVSDDGSNAETLNEIRRFAKNAPYQLKLLENNHAGCGITHNTGIRAATGDILVLMADDVLPTPMHLAEHARVHTQYPEPHIGVVGKLEQSPQLPDTPFQNTWDRVINRRFPKNQHKLDYRDFWVNNISMKRSFLDGKELFKSWPAASHEDIELGYRLQRQGLELIFCETALAYHHHPETVDSVSRRAYAHGYNWELFESNVPDLWVRARSGHFIPGDPAVLRLALWLRRNLRSLLFNSLTVPNIALPALRLSDQNPWLGFTPRLFATRVAAHYFDKGLRDREHRRPFQFP
jgi:glycosyltransferase involved in cell wall biosynthesis